MPCQSGNVPVATLQSLLQLHKPFPTAFMTIERQRVDKARNAMVIECLKNNFDYLFMVDDDNPIPPDALEKMIEDDKDIVIAPILARNPDKNGNYALCAFYKEEVNTSAGKLRLYFNIEKFRDEGYLHEIDGAGTGCILIKKRVLQVLNVKYKSDVFEFGDIRFEPIEVRGGTYDRRTMSEDCEFSERAKDMGFEIWLDDRIRPFHITTYNLIQWRNNNINT